MLSILPDLAPRDSHSLWYTSTRNPLSSNHPLDAYTSNQHQQQQQQHQDGLAGANSHRNGRVAHLLEQSPLARLHADEQNMERRRQNVASFGSVWLKPPGVPKTLHQLREERREAEEHQEVLRREQLAAELAEAEAAGMAAGVDAMLDAQQGDAGDDGVMDDVQLDGARDLDDDIPEAEEADFGGGSDDEEEEDEDEDDDDDENADDPEQRVARTQQQLMAQRMRQADDAFRESMARGREDANYYGVDEEVDDEDQAQMIEEDDLIGQGDGGDMGMDMDADLDDDIPEAEDAGYEHTDSEVELSSNSSTNGDQAEMSFAAHASQSQQQPPRYRHSLARSDATRNSLTISDILSHDGSMLGSSPEVQRRNSGAPRRLGRG